MSNNDSWIFLLRFLPVWQYHKPVYRPNHCLVSVLCMQILSIYLILFVGSKDSLKKVLFWGYSCFLCCFFCCLVIYTIPFLWIKAVFIGAVLKQSLETERQPSSFWFFSLFSVVTLQRRMLYVCIALAANKENQITWHQGGMLKKQLK